MPPVWRYWPVYILVLMICFGLAWTWHAYGSFAAYGVPAPAAVSDVGDQVAVPDEDATQVDDVTDGQAGSPSLVPLSPSLSPSVSPSVPLTEAPLAVPLGEGAPSPPGPAIPSTAPVLFAGVAVAALAIIANTWSQWQTSRIAHALQGLQTLRTDREYLINISAARAEIAKSSETNVGEPLGPDLLAAMLDTDNVSGNVDHPTFRDASLFVLNQYEFLAAGARSGAIDLVLMERTLAGPIKVLLTTYAPAIRRMRADNDRAFVNLIWLHRIMSGKSDLNLDPEPPETES